MTASGRFAHRKSYVVQMGLKHRLQVYHYETLDKFRYEMGKPVYGHAFIMKRLPRDQEL